MTGDRERSRDAPREPEVPEPLRARVEALFVSYRGYEPKSFQEALSAVCDLAAERVGEDGHSRRPTGDRTDAVAADRTDDDPTRESLPALDDQDSVEDIEPLLETEDADAVVQELAAEVLDEMTEDVFDELEHGVDEGTGEGVADGMGARAAGPRAPSPAGASEGVPNSLSADPESDCALCGRSFRVSVLETTILADDGSVALVCPDCEG